MINTKHSKLHKTATRKIRHCNAALAWTARRCHNIPHIWGEMRLNNSQEEALGKPSAL